MNFVFLSLSHPNILICLFPIKKWGVPIVVDLFNEPLSSEFIVLDPFNDENGRQKCFSLVTTQSDKEAGLWGGGKSYYI